MTGLSHAYDLIVIGLPHVRTYAQLRAWAENLYFNSEAARRDYPGILRNTRPWVRFADAVIDAVRQDPDLSKKFSA